MDKLTKITEDVVHTELLLSNTIGYLMELWSINETEEEVVNKFKDILGFTDEDIKKYYIV